MLYTPLIRETNDLVGFIWTTPEDSGSQHVEVVKRAFLQSDDPNGRLFMNAVLGQISVSPIHDLNRLLVVIRTGKAHIYKDFPLQLQIRAKTDIKAGPVHTNQILDIEEVYFKDDIEAIDIRDSDSIIWLFRYEWLFGLYFDMTGSLEVKTLWKTLGKQYRKLTFATVYSTLADETKFNRLLGRGWFPFVQLLGGEFERLVLSLSHRDENELERVERNLIDEFTRDRVHKISEHWWKREVFRNKRTILQAGLDAFNRGGNENNILCIKTLVSEIEGILKLDFFRRTGKRPPKQPSKSLQHANALYSDYDSLTFPRHFISYLEQCIFTGFDLLGGEVNLSRHSVTHGMVEACKYNKIFALQLVLILDQIHFYLDN